MSRLQFRSYEQEDEDNPAIDAADSAADTAGYVFREGSNPASKRRQRKDYVNPKNGPSTSAAAETTDTPKKRKKADKEKKKAGEYIKEHWKGFAVAVVLLLLVVFLSNSASSCSVIGHSGISGLALSTYPSRDQDMLAAEAAYTGMERDLQTRLDHYEETHSYDEYIYELDDIHHDPYVLISAITALKGGEWTMGEVGGILSLLFEKQYILTETVTEETRYRTEWRQIERPMRDQITGEFVLDEYGWQVMEQYWYTVQVPYTYRICTVKLENFELSHVPVYVMTQDQLSLYAMYMGVLGNRPDLFRGSAYIAMYYALYDRYEIPPEALEDEQFAAMIKEAEKYLGYPYVWGGSSPSTSFDCSGFVSWVVNNCGVGWSVGRRTAQGLLNICTPIYSSNAKPGDLIFFQGTYDTADLATHVGIYVGGGMMIHCGDPIQYSSIESSYFQQHFLAFGRLPSP